MKRINELFDVEEDFEIYSIHSDSRYVRKNSIFFCVDGLSVDGHRYISDAIFYGAKVIVYSKRLTYKKQGILYIMVDDVLSELNRVASLFYDDPSLKLKMIGITGSSGKSTVSLMLKDVLSKRMNVGFIGTNYIEYANKRIQCPYTTPESIFMQRQLSQMVKHKMDVAALEVSSHGIALKRIDGVHFDIAVFTNVCEEHIDFHGTLDKIMATKAELFINLETSKLAVLNADEVRFMNLIKDSLRCNVITYGIDHKANVMARNIQLYIDHSEFDLFIDNENSHMSLPVIGKVNIYNVLAVISVLKGMGYSALDIYEMISCIRNTEGRMELIRHNHPFHVIVDYCQSNKSYEEIFKFARSVKRPNGRLIAVLSPAGKKFSKKRLVFQDQINQYLDHVIITENDNKDEDFYETCLELHKHLHPTSIIIEDREIAIEQAIEIANKDDIILILGKGHEKFLNTPLGQVPYKGDIDIAYEAIHQVYDFNDDGY